MGMFRKCHLVRVLRISVILLLVIVLLTVSWQFISGTSQISRETKDHKSAYDIGKVDRWNNLDGYDQANIPEYRAPVRQAIPDDNHDMPLITSKISKFEASKNRMSDPQAQALLDYIGESLIISYNVLANEGERYHVNLTLLNSGSEFIRPCCWAIYLYHMKFIDTDLFNGGRPVLMRNEWPRRFNKTIGAVKWPSSFEMSHVKGYTFRLKPNNKFDGLKPGEYITFRLSGGGWAVSYSEVLPNWYVANDVAHTEPRVIKSTADDPHRFVGPFDTVEKSTRSESDFLRPFTAEQRFKKNKVANLGRAPNMPIIPTPLIFEKSENNQKVRVDGKGWSIQYQVGTVDGANYIKKYLKTFTSQDLISISDSDETHCKPKLITLRLSDSLPLKPNQNLVVKEGYILTVSPENDCISIVGPTPAGLLYGAITLVNLAENEGSASSPIYAFPAVEITDAPRYEYRGIMFDVVRNFHTKKEIMKLMETMAMYKLNKLHLHLGDDEGWRLEIPELPELTEYGGKRGHDEREENHLMAMLGSGPFTNSSGSGFYTVKEYREILIRARELNIEVIPEFDMPGHSHAAINSMLKRYRTLLKKGEEKDGLQYLLSDLADESVYMSGQFFKDSAVNPCIASTYRFVELIVKSVINVYKNISPLKRFHFGGDEVPGDAYTASPACSQFLMRHPKLSDAKSLKSYFVRRVISILAKYDLTPFGWEDGYSMDSGYPIPRKEMEAKQVISQAWYNVWESGLAMRAYQYANIGYQVVLSPTTALYMDNPQEPDPDDWGLHWATRYVDTKRTFMFMPEAMYDNIDTDFMGRPISKSELCDTNRIQCPPLNEPQNIIGLEGATWSELIRTEEHMDSMLWPRMIAAAERAWHKADWETTADPDLKVKKQKRDWARFTNALGYRELKRMESIGVYYYLSRPGVRVKSGSVYVNTLFPGLNVQVSQDGGRTWKDFDQSTSYRGRTLFATRSFDGKRRSVPVEVNIS